LPLSVFNSLDIKLWLFFGLAYPLGQLKLGSDPASEKFTFLSSPS